MFRYGDFPPQERHIEDNIQNIPNDPIYGIELDKFQSGEKITQKQPFFYNNQYKLSSFLPLMDEETKVSFKKIDNKYIKNILYMQF